MRSTLLSAFTVLLVAAPAIARADIGGCLAGPNELDRCSVSGEPAAILAAIAAPVLVAGAAVSVAHELRHRAEERDPSSASASAASASGKAKRAPATLALVPDPPDPYRAPAGKLETRHKPSAAFQLNETATNVATAVTAAAVVGAVIGTIVGEAHHGK